jgi:hypothetical protein
MLRCYSHSKRLKTRVFLPHGYPHSIQVRKSPHQNIGDRVSSAKGVHLVEILLRVTKQKSAQDVCKVSRDTRYIKFRRELGFGPVVNWFGPAPVLLAVMLSPPI